MCKYMYEFMCVYVRTHTHTLPPATSQSLYHPPATPSHTPLREGAKHWPTSPRHPHLLTTLYACCRHTVDPETKNGRAHLGRDDIEAVVTWVRERVEYRGFQDFWETEDGEA